jgi:hypothetical protein
MANYQTLWQQIQATYNAIVQHHIGGKLGEHLEKSPMAQVQGWQQLGLAYIIKPDPLTVQRIQTRNPYTRAENFQTQINNLQEAGYLDTNGVATEKVGEYEALVDYQNTILQGLGQQYQGDATRLKALVTRVVDKARSLADAPCVKDASLRDISRWSDFEQAFYQMQRLFAFRDDAHLNAWKHLDIDAQKYEAWSLVWDGSAPSVEKILEVRGNRGYSEEEWQAVYDKLVEKGWLVTGEEAGTYQVSAESKPPRDAIETTTDEYFYGIFAVLSDAEADELLNMLKAAQEQFTPEPEAS